MQQARAAPDDEATPMTSLNGIALERLADPNNRVLEWDQVKREPADPH